MCSLQLGTRGFVGLLDEAGQHDNQLPGIEKAKHAVDVATASDSHLVQTVAVSQVLKEFLRHSGRVANQIQHVIYFILNCQGLVRIEVGEMRLEEYDAANHPAKITRK